jgi:TolB-like protein
MKDVQLRSQSVVVRPGGVLALSRRLEDLDPEAEAYAVLVGTYTQIGARLFVNVRVVRAQDNVVLAAADMDLPAKALVPRPELPYREPSVATTLPSRAP